MKKKVFKFAAFIFLLMLPVGLIVSFSKPKNEFLTQVNSVNIKDLGAYVWTVYNSDVEYIKNNILVNVNYDTLYSHKIYDNKERLDVLSHQDYYVYNNDTIVKSQTSENDLGSSDDEHDTLSHVDIRSLNDNFYYMNGTDHGINQVRADSKNFSLYKYDSASLAKVGRIALSDFDYDEYYITIANDNLIVLLTTDEVELNDLTPEEEASSEVCELYSVDKDFKTANKIDCNYNNLNTYFPKYIVQVKDQLDENKVDYRDGEIVEIKDDNTIVYTDKNNNQTEIKTDVGPFTNVKFFKDKIVVLEDTVGNLNTNFYYSRINLYSKDGEMIDQVTGLSSYEDLKVDESNNKIAVAGILLKKVVASPFGKYAYENYDASEAVLSYEEYTYKEPEPENPPIIPEIPIITNPETSDIIIAGFVALFGISLYIYIKCKKAL